MSITHNKKRNPSLNFLIHCISARSGECTFVFLNFLIIDLCNSSANSWFEIFSFLIPLSVNLFYVAKVSGRARVAEVFYHKIYRPLKQVRVDIHDI